MQEEEPKQTGKPRTRRTTIKRVLRWVLAVLLLPVILVFLLGVALYIPAVQDLVRGKAVDFLHEKLGTQVGLEKLVLRFPLGLSLHGFHLADQQGDTLIHAGELKARVSLTGFFNNSIHITGLALADTRAHLAQDADSVFNFQFIVDAFAGDSDVEEEPSEGPGWTFTVDGVSLKNIHFSTDMRPSRMELDLRLGELDLPLKTFDLDSMRFHAEDLRIADLRIAMASAPSEPEPDTYPLLESPFGDLDLKMRSATLERIAFTMATHDGPDSLWLSVAEVKLDVNDLDTRDQRFDLRRLLVDGLDYGMVSGVDQAEVEVVTEPPWLAEQDGFRFFLRDLDVRIDEVDVRASSFAMHQERVATPVGTFDPAHVVITGLSARLNGLVANNDLVAARINEFGGRYGTPAQDFQVSTDLRATPAVIDVAGTQVRWNDLQAQLSAHIEQGSLHNAYRSPERVPMQLQLSAAVPQEHQAQLFALLPSGTLPVASIPEGFELDARVVGTMERLDTIHLELLGDAGTVLNLSGSVDHANNADRLAFDLHVEPFTMGAGVRSIARAYATDVPVFPAHLSLRASAQGDPNRMRATFDLGSDLAHANGHVQLDGWKKELPDAVDVDLRATGIALAELLGDTAWRKADVLVRAEAKALNSDQRTGSLEVRPTKLVHQGVDLSDLLLTGTIQGDSVFAQLEASSDPLTLAMKASSTWPAKNEDLRASVDLKIARADLKALGVVDHDLAVTGNWNGEVVTDTAGQLSVALVMDGTGLESGSQTFVFETLAVSGYMGVDSTSATVRSDALDVLFNANIGVDTLVVRMMEKGRSYFTTDTAYRTGSGERFDLSVDLKRNEWLAGMMVPGLHAVELERLVAHYDGDKDELMADISLPLLRYDSVQVNGTSFSLDAMGRTMNARLAVEHIEQGEYWVDGLSVDAQGSGGDLSAALRIASDEVERYAVGMEFHRIPEGMEFHLKPELVLDMRPWVVDAENSLRITDDRLIAERFTLSSADERIELHTPERMLEIGLDGLRIATLANIISTPDSFPLADGRMRGTVRLPANGSTGLAVDLTIDELELLATDLGTLDLDFLGEANERYKGKAVLTHEVNRFDAKVDIAPENLRGMAALDLRDISFLRPFISEYVYELSGGLDGAVSLIQQGERTDLRGRLHFKEARVGVVATGATYTLVDEVVEMNDAGIRMKEFDMLDSLGNVFRLDGDIRTAANTDPQLDLRIRTERFQLVSSTIEQNEQFFGDLFARIDLNVSGAAVRPKVKGELGILSGTDFSVVLPGSTVELVNAEGIVVFTDDINAVDTLALNGDAAALRDSLQALLPGVELDLRIKVDKEAVFAIVLDPAAGDQATVSGAADLEFRYAPDAPMYLSGPFIVEQGAYTLDLYGLVKKRFELVKGGSVRWSGDPVKAEMDLRARYLSETAPFALVASEGTLDSERNRLQQPLPFEVLINIAGNMTTPAISFGIDLDRQVRNSFPKVNNKLDQLNQQGNDEELNRQVFGLLVLNSFIQDEGSGGSPSSGIATSAARNSVNGLLTDQMNKLTGRYLKGVDISLGVNTYDQMNGESNYQRTSLDYRVSKSVLDDRLSFEVGGSVGVDEQNSQVSNVSNTRAAQYAILYDLTRDGRFRIRGFHENAYDLYDGEIANSGVAFMFTKEFEENERARTAARKREMERRENRKAEQYDEPGE